MIRLCPVASNTMSFVIVIVLVSVIVPSHANVTVPPPFNAVCSLGQSQFVTVPEA